MINRRKGAIITAAAGHSNSGNGSPGGDTNHPIIGGTTITAAAPGNKASSKASSSSKLWRYFKSIGFLLVGLFLVLLILRNPTNHNSSSARTRNSDLSSSSSLSLAVVDEMSNRLLELYYSGATSTASSHTQIPRLDIHDPNAMGRGTQEPVLLEGWSSSSSSSSDWTQQGLMQRVGHFPQYLKDLTVQPLKRTKSKTKNDGQVCVVPGNVVAKLLSQHYDLLFFTNNQENESFMKEIMPPFVSSTSAPSQKNTMIPRPLQHINGFQVFSAMGIHKSHSFHRHGESWLGQVEGRRQWWFLPPDTIPPPSRVDACGYLTGESPIPPGATTILQEPGHIIWFPTNWYHATCALDEWTVGIGAQQGKTIRQNFPKLDPWGTGTNNKAPTTTIMTTEQIQTTLRECLGDEAAKSYKVDEKITISTPPTIPKAKSAPAVVASSTTTSTAAQTKDSDNEWKWFDGDLNAYYNSLEKDHNRDPNKLSDYAVHRWLGPKRSTEEQYRVLDEAAAQFLDLSLLTTTTTTTTTTTGTIQVLDGGCGLGSGLMWMEQQHPTWMLTGYTVSEEQYKFIEEKLPPHKFQVHLQSYDDLAEDNQYDFIYSIEALIHSPNATRTMEIWAQHLKPGGVLAILDDFVVGNGPEAKQVEGMQDFAKSWLANSLFSTQELGEIGKQYGLEVVQDRDLIAEYNIIGLNYRNQVPEIHPFGGRVHQGWMGSKWRQRLTVQGKLTYNLLVMKKPTTTTTTTTTRSAVTKSNGEDFQTSRRASTLDKEMNGETNCAAVPSKAQNQRAAEYTMITPQLMSGRGNNGGEKIVCISGWYCCNKGTEWWDRLDKERTDNTAFLKLERNLFGHYIDSFAKHLNDHYATHPESIGGRFLDIGGTGSTASGMTQVTSKFQHFAGPLEYWKLDSDPAAKDLERTLYCDIEDCSGAETCGYDVTFSHTVLEHATRPWLAFDTIARITKKGGLTMHLVPFSYQYHATPDDNYRFSHKALISLLEDRGFEVLEVGYDICTKPNNMLRRVDEHYDTIWLTYVIGRKL